MYSVIETPAAATIRRSLTIALIWFGIGFILSFYIQFGLLERLKTVAVEALTTKTLAGARPSQIVRAVGAALTVGDMIVLGLGVLVLSTAFLLEWRQRTFSDLLSWVCARPSRALLLLFVLGLLFYKGFFLPGEPYAGDAPAHLSRTWHAALSFRQGYLFPTYNNYYHNGFRLFSYYGSLYYLISALLTVAAGALFGLLEIGLPDFLGLLVATKLLLFLFSLLALLLFYRLGIVRYHDRGTALLLATTIMFNVAILHRFFWWGHYFLLPMYPLLALLLLCIEQRIRRAWSLRRTIIIGAVAGAGLIYAHAGYALGFFYLLGIYGILRLCTSARSRLLPMGLGIAAIILPLAAYALVPVLFERELANFFPEFPFTDPDTYRFWTFPFARLIVPNPLLSGLRFIGWVTPALAIALPIIAWRSRIRGWWPYLLLPLLVVLVLNYNRFFPLLPITLGLFIAQLYHRLHRQAGANGHRLLALLLLLLFFDWTLFDNFNTYNGANRFEHELYSRLAREPDGTRLGVVKAATLQTGDQTDNRIFVSPWLKVSGHRVLQPNAIMLEANRQALYQFGITHDLLVRDVRARRLTQTTVDGLQLIGVRYLTFHNSRRYYIPDIAARSDIARQGNDWLELQDTAPLLFATRLVSVAELAAEIPALRQRARFEEDDVSHARAPFRYREWAGDYLRTLIEQHGLRGRDRIAERFVVASADPKPGVTPQQPADGQKQPRVVVSDYQLDVRSLRIAFSTDQAGFARVPFAYYPFLAVILDDQPVPFRPDAMGFIVLEIAAPGEHSLQIDAPLSPISAIGAWITAVTLILLVVWVVAVRILGRNRRKRNDIAT